MNNEEKAQELYEEIGVSFEFKSGVKAGAREMACWKDAEFKKKTDKMYKKVRSIVEARIRDIRKFEKGDYEVLSDDEWFSILKKCFKVK